MEAGRGAALPGANQRRCVNPNEGGGESRSDLDSGAKARGAGGVRHNALCSATYTDVDLFSVLIVDETFAVIKLN
ncbi:Uncharacterised protein [Pragia fontium]|uniref:Uncharacterized protein n=1 Tax=Pragia fontium TaxID=82985 RepID=A0ABQ5LF66_9GAMM|nr:hypothetical protein [Pragia fontium]GKX62039.1 hypothetical protein SOASR032_06080 [Pragia fontium]SUB82163.1 Uncharacterised protein [Pragia fontium]